ncbi:hypothetical protein [Microvirga sp. VF16]|uniref:hypothetical protein n=1 Tax=Microvirga sp. VF16 TaxID=2807101 RepID=UPI00193E67D0|nr:hypothetical protein [Microvirga sp. VF16]QRM35432.1 hypothetical protein JO965_44605 [Microvirga sp. VF16]
MTAPAPRGPNIINNHIAKRAPSRHDNARQPTLAQRLSDPTTRWRRITVTSWYGGQDRHLAVVSGTALWYHPGKCVPIRWVLVRDLAGEFEP